ncbi:MAG: tetratricopeptide repeat protein [Anaerolineales bacterium]|nr:tetratricopeptide repeat protein [Anaerolineales bacterium]
MKLALALLLCLGLLGCTLPTSPQAAPPSQAGSADQLTAAEPSPTPAPSFDEYLALAQDAANAADWATAIAYLDAALVLDGQSAQAYWQRGVAQQSTQALDAALQDFDQALALAPEWASAYQSRGLLHIQRGDAAAALADLNRAIELAPTFAQAYRNRAALQRSLGNYTAASFDLQVYLSLVPSAPERASIEAEIGAMQQQALAQAGADGLLFTDDFSNPASGWYSNGGPETRAAYEQGGYLLEQTQPNAVVWALPGRIVSDVRVQVASTRTGGDDNNFFGLLCRVQGTGQTGDFYAFLISSDGYFGISKKSGDALELIGQEMMLRHPAIRLGGEPNRIEALCAGERLALYVNGELVAETNDAEYASGQVGLLVGALEAGGSQILFDDFAVYSAAP